MHKSAAQATRWLPAADVCDLPEFEEKASDLNALLEGVRDSLLPVQGGAQAQAQAF